MKRFQPAPEVALGEVLDFLRLMWALEHALEKRSKRLGAETGITDLQRFVLRIVGRFPGISAGRLAQVLHVHPSTLSGVLARLDEKGLLDRRIDPRDARRMNLGLTPKGRVLDHPERGTIEYAAAHVLEEFPPETIGAARNVMAAMIDALDH